jgi:hypothetical protein
MHAAPVGETCKTRSGQSPLRVLNTEVPRSYNAGHPEKPPIENLGNLSKAWVLNRGGGDTRL